MPSRRTVAILGGGSAGFSGAIAARDAGARVLLFAGDAGERSSLCINSGCMPAKALFEPLDAMHRAREQGWRQEWKRGGDVLEQVVRRKEREIARFRAFRQQALAALACEDVRIVEGCARFVEPHAIECKDERFPFDAAVIATGSVRVVPDIEGYDAVREHAWGNDEILDNTSLPDSMIVIGAGAIGMQFSLRYARLGCDVTIVSDSGVLPRFPPNFGERLARIYEGEGIRVMTHRRAVRVRRDSGGWFVLETEGGDGAEPLVAEKLLVAVGRRPALENLGLEVLGIERDAAGLLRLGEDLRVRGADEIFAAGDAVGYRMTVHKANLEARIAAFNAATGESRHWDKRANIKVIYTDPEFAFAGIDAATAEGRGHRAIVASKESRLVGRLHLAGDDAGFGEFVADAKNGELLGAGLLCSDASVLIHLPAYAIQHRHTVDQALEAEYYHPTKLGIVQGILEKLRGDREELSRAAPEGV